MSAMWTKYCYVLRRILLSRLLMDSILYPILKSFLGFMIFIPIAAYIGSRMILLILPLMLLRNLPPAALQELKWSEFFPHIWSVSILCTLGLSLHICIFAVITILCINTTIHFYSLIIPRTAQKPSITESPLLTSLRNYSKFSEQPSNPNQLGLSRNLRHCAYHLLL